MNEIASNNIHIRAYSADGYEITVILAGVLLADVAKKLVEVRAAGYLAERPEAAGNEQKAIASVMRHVTDSGTVVIGAYPHWKNEGKYGEYKFASIYMDSPEDIAQFEAQSGLKLDDIPLSDGEVGVRRKYGKIYPKEIAVKRSFDMLRIPDGLSDDGKPRYRYEYVTKLPVTILSAGWSLEEVRAFVARWKGDDLTEADLIKALNVTRWGEWKKTRAEADEAVTAYIKANLDAEPATTRTQPLAKIDCPTHLLEEGDVIHQCTKDDHGPVESRFEVIKNGGMVGREYRLQLRNLKTNETKIFMWAAPEHTLCDGPKVRAYAADPTVCLPAKNYGRPMWDKQFAEVS